MSGYGHAAVIYEPTAAFQFPGGASQNRKHHYRTLHTCSYWPVKFGARF